MEMCKGSNFYFPLSASKDLSSIKIFALIPNIYTYVHYTCRQRNRYVYIMFFFMNNNACFFHALEKYCPKSKQPFANRDETHGEM